VSGVFTEHLPTQGSLSRANPIFVFVFVTRIHSIRRSDCDVGITRCITNSYSPTITFLPWNQGDSREARSIRVGC
jgi:hypothetical protein